MADKDNTQQMNTYVVKKGAGSGEATSPAMDYEDGFHSFYGLDIDKKRKVDILTPTYPPELLLAQVHKNNTLMPCIDAMVANVYGTGYDILDPNDEAKDKDSQKKTEIEDFFKQPYPGVSFTAMAKRTGEEIESVGAGYWNILRNVGGEMVFIRRLDAVTMRLIRHGAPQKVKLKLKRGSKTVETITNKRYRRFVQKVGSKKVYFKEYGCPIKLSAKTGMWEGQKGPNGKVIKIPKSDEATEVIYFTKRIDAATPYGIPAWVPQTPSVLGSRKAEEHNLEFFDAGGVPPLMIFVQGGQMAEKARKTLENFMGQNPNAKQTVPVMEVFGSGGTLDSPSTVRVTVERFGAERQKDSMFEKYDERCEKRIRRSWRLPELFLGSVDNFTFATAFASYTVAEAQVFSPERHEFDEIVNRTIMQELDAGDFIFRSRPVSVQDIQHQLAALGLVQQYISKEEMVKTVNEIANLKLRASEIVEPALVPQTPPTNTTITNTSATPASSIPVEPPKKATKSEMGRGYDLAQSLFKGLAEGVSKADMLPTLNSVLSLNDEDRHVFKAVLLEKLTGDVFGNDDDYKMLVSAALLPVLAD